MELSDQQICYLVSNHKWTEGILPSVKSKEFEVLLDDLIEEGIDASLKGMSNDIPVSIVKLMMKIKAYSKEYVLYSC